MTFDLIVIGGGINGAGIARDAALRGLRVCLLEKQDYGWATSAKSSRLAHGGLRYLELFEFGLVHEALHEREHWLQQAPHLTRPLQFLYPIYPHVAARRTVRVGLGLYDLLSRGKSMPKRKYYNKAKTLALAPGLNPEGLSGGATYYDGQIRSVERFVQELIWDARKHGADCRNYTTVTGLVIEAGQCKGVTIQTSAGNETVHAGAVVNAAGPWIDDILPARAAPLIRKTKGIHIVVPKFVDVALIVKAARDGRTFFVLPTEDGCIIGTTDTDFAGDAGQAHATPEDVAYLVEEASRYFPDAPLYDIQYTYAGVRALVNQAGLTESNVTRKHIIYDHSNEGMAGLWSLQGGKITTYRSLAEAAVNKVCQRVQPGKAKQHPTRKRPMPGCPSSQWPTYRQSAINQAQGVGLDADVATHLVDTYGARWSDVLAQDPGGHARLVPNQPVLQCEVTWMVQEEQATCVGDVMLRRSQLGLAPHGNPQAAAAVATWLGKLGINADLAGYQEALKVLANPVGPTVPSDQSSQV